MLAGKKERAQEKQRSLGFGGENCKAETSGETEAFRKARGSRWVAFLSAGEIFNLDQTMQSKAHTHLFSLRLTFDGSEDCLGTKAGLSLMHTALENGNDLIFSRSCPAPSAPAGARYQWLFPADGTAPSYNNTHLLLFCQDKAIR